MAVPVIASLMFFWLRVSLAEQPPERPEWSTLIDEQLLVLALLDKFSVIPDSETSPSNLIFTYEAREPLPGVQDYQRFYKLNPNSGAITGSQSLELYSAAENFRRATLIKCAGDHRQNGSIYCAGGDNTGPFYSPVGLIWKLNSIGGREWGRWGVRYPGVGTWGGVTTDASGDYAYVATDGLRIGYDNGIRVNKYDTAGNLIFETWLVYDRDRWSYNTVGGVAVDSNGIYLSSKKWNTIEAIQYNVARISNTVPGQAEWEHSFTLEDIFDLDSVLDNFEVSTDNRGGIVVLTSNYRNLARPTFFVGKYDSAGNLIWQNGNFGSGPSTPNGAKARAIALDSDGNAYAVGHNPSYPPTPSYVVKYNSSSGDIVWDLTSGDRTATFNAIALDRSGNIYLGGETYNPSHRTLVVKYAQSATPPPTVSLSADRNTITLGESAFLTWTSNYADSCRASGTPSEDMTTDGPGNNWSGQRNTSRGQPGERATPTMTGPHTYTLTCNGSGVETSDSVNINVQQQQPQPSMTPTMSIFQVNRVSYSTQRIRAMDSIRFRAHFVNGPVDVSQLSGTFTVSTPPTLPPANLTFDQDTIEVRCSRGRDTEEEVIGYCGLDQVSNPYTFTFSRDSSMPAGSEFNVFFTGTARPQTSRQREQVILELSGNYTPVSSPDEQRRYSADPLKFDIYQRRPSEIIEVP